MESLSKRGIYYAMLLNLFDQRTFDQTTITCNTTWEMCSKLIRANTIVRTHLLECYQLNPGAAIKALRKSGLPYLVIGL